MEMQEIDDNPDLEEQNIPHMPGTIYSNIEQEDLPTYADENEEKEPINIEISDSLLNPRLGFIRKVYGILTV